MKRLCTTLAALALMPPLMAAGEADVQRCRALAADATRLACYDALFGRPGVPAAATPSPTPAAAVAAFGLPQPAAPMDAITSHIPGRFTGWEPNDRITLANGQVWQIADRSRGAYRLDDPKVKVRRGAMGSFFLEIEGQNQAPRVRRVQ